MQESAKPWLADELATSNSGSDDMFARSTPLPDEARKLIRVRTQARRLRNPTRGTDLGTQLEELLSRVDHSVSDAKAGRQPLFDVHDFESELDYIRRGVSGKERPVLDEYGVVIDLDQGSNREVITNLLDSEVASLLSQPGGKWLAAAMLDQLDQTSELNLTQSLRSAGMRLKTTPQMREDVQARKDAGQYDDDYVAYFERACPEGKSWPVDENGEPWQVDHVFELWQSGADDNSNFLPIDKSLHAAKNLITKRFCAAVRDANRVDGSQVELFADLTGELVSNEGS